MLTFLTATANLPFTVALGVMLILLLIEIVSLGFGVAASGVFDSMLPDVDGHGIHVGDGGGSELAGAQLAERCMQWLHIGRVPMLILIATLLTGFGLCGLALQWIAAQLTGALLPAWIAAPVTVFPALFFVHVVGDLIARVLPQDETDAVSSDSFVGRSATIVLGTARVGAAAQAWLRDEHGKRHYVMVEPRHDGDAFEAGERVRLVARDGARFRAEHDSG